MPLTVFVGPEAKDGQGLVSFGSNHGNEYEGPCVLKHLVRDIRMEDVRGRIILIPVLNPAAFLAGTRESKLDDGVNLNRAFVDGAGVTPALAGITHRIAAFVRNTSGREFTSCWIFIPAAMSLGLPSARIFIRLMIPNWLQKSKRQLAGSVRPP
jgi:hypothetical protein